MSRDDLFKAIDVADLAQLNALLDADSALASCRSSDGVSAVLFTLYLAKPDLTKALLDHDPALDIFDAAALNIPREMGMVSDINAFSGDGFSALHLACFFGSLDCAALLAEQGADVNIIAANPSELRPIHSACAAGHGAIVALLLKAKADPNVTQAGGYSPLMTAASLGNAPMACMLLEAGADIMVVSDDNRTAADFARAAGFESLVEKLS